MKCQVFDPFKIFELNFEIVEHSMIGTIVLQTNQLRNDVILTDIEYDSMSTG